MAENTVKLSAGQPAPLFRRVDIQGVARSLQDFRGKVVILNFWSAECPWARRTDEALQELLEDWGDPVVLLSVASNVNEGEELVRRVADERNLPHLLIDKESRLADLYGAQTTPHLFVIDAQGILRYQGALDDVTFRRRNPTRDYLRQAVQAVLAGENPDPDQTPAYGCAIVRPV
jgi:peroxiredoxin